MASSIWSRSPGQSGSAAVGCALVNRRKFVQTLALAGSAACLPRRLAAASTGPAGLTKRVLQVEGRWANRALLLVPEQARVRRSAPLLVLLHGLGETKNERLGLRAWDDLYGLSSAYDRLCAPPVEPLAEGAGYMTQAKRDALNATLTTRGFDAPIAICPYTPNPYVVMPRHRVLDEYAAWLVERLLPAVRAELGPSLAVTKTGLDGCSMGGYLALEAFLRRPQAFSTLGMVQGAIRKQNAVHYASKLEAAVAGRNPCPIHLSTSTEDPFLEPTNKLYYQLRQRGVASHLETTPGPHNQVWLRQVGTIDMLLWHAVALGDATAAHTEPVLAPDARAQEQPRAPEAAQ